MLIKLRNSRATSLATPNTSYTRNQKTKPPPTLMIQESKLIKIPSQIRKTR